jgi:hypothetical protein
LEGQILTAASSPDGKCLIVHLKSRGTVIIRLFHLSSLEPPQGIEVLWPEQISSLSSLTVSSIDNRSIPHLIFLDLSNNSCTSLLLQITQRSTEFDLRIDHCQDHDHDKHKKTVHNSLIDCHAQLWNLFPIGITSEAEAMVSTKRHPNSIKFVSSTSPSCFGPYFSSLIREFEIKSRKRIVNQIHVATSTDWDPTEVYSNISEFQVGEWLMNLLCLIPILLATTNSRGFRPRKDGILPPLKEDLGASVLEISRT